MDGEAFAGELVKIDDDERMVFRTVADEGAADETRTLSLAELVRWGHPVEARPQTIVVLAGGGRLVTAADWSGGAAVRLEDETVTVLSDTFDEEHLPRAAVRGVVFAQWQHPNERAALVQRMRSFHGQEDAIFLTNGDRLVGSLEKLEAGSLTIATKAGTAKLPLSRVEAVALGASQSSVVSRSSQLIVGLCDGSVLYADAVRGDDNELVLELADGAKFSGGSVEDVVSLQSLAGPFVYLSDLEPADYRHVPYLDIEWPYQRDRSVAGGPLGVGGEPYLKGIGMHSASRLTYRLDGKYRRFDAAVAVDDSAGQRGSVTFGVYLLRDGQWQEAYKSGIVRGGDAPLPVSVDVTGAEGLTLTVDYADRGDELDRADWLEARLIKN